MKNFKCFSLFLIILLLFFIAGSFLGYWKGNELFSYCKNLLIKKQETIFISIVSYRDKNCPKTLEEIYNKADHPERIFVGIYQQNGAYDLSCQTPNIDFKLQKNISLVKVPAEKARGPAVARYHASLLFKDEDFFLEIDAHMRLVPHWDTLLLKMWHKLAEEKGPKVILTTCPLDWNVESDTIDPSHETHLPLSCGMDFSHEGELPRIASHVYKKTSVFHESPFIAGGFFFAPGKFLKEVPYDPNLAYLVWGEEALLSIRLWCKGYRFYNPTENLIFHYYERLNEPKIWNDDPNYQEINAKTSEHVKILIGFAPGKEDKNYPYGIDSQCVKEFYKTYKIDPINRTSVNLCDPEERVLETSSKDLSSNKDGT
ncbi:MAG: hypothetical protein JSS34_01925 [Proteobacteria bacterium]|nr:hypothetical protein [Pseudomonadota bacterium]